MQGFGKAFHREFRAMIQAAKRKGHTPPDRGDIHDHAFALCTHLGKYGLGDLEQPDHVRVELTADSVHVESFQWTIGAVASVV